MVEEKVCVILASAGVIAQGASQGRGQLPDRWNACIGQACAWYAAAAERCAVLTLARKA
mgnify:CR=1 FL=1